MNNLQKTFKNSNVIITGHTGFKGSWLTLWLKYLGANVTGISLDPPTNPSHFNSLNISDEINDIRLDVRDLKKLKETIIKLKPDFVFHLAAQPLVKLSYECPVETWSSNTIGTVNVLESLRLLNSKCVAVFITSDKCYNNVEWDWGYRETDELGGPDPYSASKGGAELAIRSYYKSYFADNKKIKIGIGRAGNVIGGGDWAVDRIVTDSIKAWSVGDIVSLRNPLSTRPWQHVLEPLSGYISLAMELNNSTKYSGEPFNFGPNSDQNFSVKKLVEEMSKHWDKVKWKDDSEKYGGPYESGLLKLNCDKSLAILNWKPVWDFEKTVLETISWYKNFYDYNISSRDKTLSQIIEYISDAKKKELKWAI